MFPGKLDTECVDSADDRTLFDTWLSVDVLSWISTNLRSVSPAEGGVMPLGYSAGGWCSAVLGVRHPDLFRASVNLAGYFTPEHAKGEQMRPDGDVEYGLPEVVRGDRPRTAMYLFAGGNDVESLDSLKLIVRAVKAADGPTSITVEKTEKGGHLIDLWVAATPGALTWLARTDPAFAPA